MATRERKLIERLIKTWAQDHNTAFTIADLTPTEQGMRNTEGYLTWVVRNEHTSIDLLSLADKIEIFLEMRRKRKHPDGMHCKTCHIFYQFAEANQEDGSMI